MPSAGLVAVACSVVAWAVLPYGPGHSPDSATYLAAARSLAHLRGYLDLDAQTPMLDFPPLYPATLAVGTWLGASLSTTAAVVDALSLAALALAVRSLALRLNLSAPAALGLGLLATVLPPVVDSDTSVLSEPMFLALTAVVAATVAAMITAGADRRRSLVLVTALSAACLTRYLGVGLVAGSTFALLVMSPVRSWRSLARPLLLAVAAVIPLSMWIVRNVVVGGSATAGDYGATSTPFLGHLHDDLTGMGSWYTGGAGGAPALTVGTLLVLVVAGVILAPVLGRGRERSPAAATAVMCAGYLSTVLLAQSMVGLDTDDRFLRPLAALLPVLAFSLARALSWPDRGHARGWWGRARPAPYVVLFMVAVLSVQSLGALLTSSAEDGLGDYDAEQWRHSQTLAALRHDPGNAPLVSNDAYAVSLLTGLPVTESPSQTYDNSTQATGDLDQFRLDAAATHPSLVWFNRPDIGGLEPLARLRRVTCLTVVATYDDGQILRSC